MKYIVQVGAERIEVDLDGDNTNSTFELAVQVGGILGRHVASYGARSDSASSLSGRFGGVVAVEANPLRRAG